MMNKVKLAIAASALAISASAASAAPVELTNLGSLGGPTASTSAGSGSGGFTMELTGGNIPNNPSHVSFVAWCIDLANNIASPKNYNASTDLITGARLNNVQRLFDQYYVKGAALTGTEVLGFQLAVWETVYETNTTNPLSLGTGNFTSHSGSSGYDAARTLAQGYLAFISNAGNVIAKKYNLTFFASDPSNASQDLVTADLAPIPLPAAAWLLIGGIGVLVATRRRRTDEAA